MNSLSMRTTGPTEQGKQSFLMNPKVFCRCSFFLMNPLIVLFLEEVTQNNKEVSDSYKIKEGLHLDCNSEM